MSSIEIGPDAPPPRSEGHMVQLDGLRALAVALVIVEHQTLSTESLGLYPGRFAVWLFYALSGFLITGILARARDESEARGAGPGGVWAAFWVRRALRIFPLYYLALFVAVALGLGPARQVWPWYAGFASNMRVAFSGQFDPALGHFWSLAVEEQFYLIWPAACLFLPRRHLLRLSLACAALAPCFRYAILRATYSSPSSIAPMPCCLDGLALGAALALTGRGPRAWVAAGGVTICVGVAAARRLHVGFSLPEASEELGFALISWWLVGRAAPGFRGPAGRLLSWAPLAYLGRISYGIYILHLLIPPAIAKARGYTGLSFAYPEGPGAFQAAYVALASAALASLSWFALERPLNGLKRYFPYVAAPRRDGPAPGPSSPGAP